MKYIINSRSDNGKTEINGNRICLTADKDTERAFFTLRITFPEWDDTCYMMMPACAYDANPIKRVESTYPPMYSAATAKANQPLMADVPALNPDRSGVMQVTAGDMALPCMGLYNRKKKQGFFILTEQEIKGKNIGYTFERGKLEISYPENRTEVYMFCDPHYSDGDMGVRKRSDEAIGIKMKEGETAESEFRIITFDCDSIPQFYEKYFQIRKSFLPSTRAPFMYTKELWDLMETHFNEDNWSGEYYAEVSKIWQCGWVGGGMSSYPLLKYGSELSKERAVMTLDYLTSHQALSGFYYGYIKNGVTGDDGNGKTDLKNMHMTRKSGDSLYYLFKHFAVVEPKNEWKESAKRCADAFVRLYDKYGTFGQFVDIETGVMQFGNSLSAAIVPAALAKSWEYFGEEKYLETAKHSLEMYYKKFCETGITNGGPGEILSAPDSESAFALLESCVVLYETDRDEKWLEYAKAVAAYCSSWVVSYTYKFPCGSEFGRLKINTVGSVFANIQNKHSAPGICTFSGDCLLKLYRYTENEAYLDFIKDIAYFIPQCVSTDEKPIFSWDTPPEKLKAGSICERVNMSDWETEERIGSVFNGSCWPETSLVLSFAELMSQPEMI